MTNLDCSCVCLVGVAGSSPGVRVVGVPDVNYVIIASTGQEPSIAGPLEATHIQGVSIEGLYLVLSQARVIMMNLPALATTSQER